MQGYMALAVDACEQGIARNIFILLSNSARKMTPPQASSDVKIPVPGFPLFVAKVQEWFSQAVDPSHTIEDAFQYAGDTHIEHRMHPLTRVQYALNQTAPERYVARVSYQLDSGVWVPEEQRGDSSPVSAALGLEHAVAIIPYLREPGLQSMQVNHVPLLRVDLSGTGQPYDPVTVGELMHAVKEAYDVLAAEAACIPERTMMH